MKRMRQMRRGSLIAVLAVMLAAAVAACGSSGTNSAASASAGGTAATTTSAASGTTTGASGTGSGKFAELRACLKAAGVTLPTRRGTGGAQGGAGGAPPSASGTGTSTGTSGAAPTGAPTGGAPSGGAPSGTAPSGTAGGGPAAGGATSTKFRAAIAACDKKLGIKGGFGAGGFGRRGGLAGAGFSAAKLKTFESCMKQHGVTLTRDSSGGGIFSKSAESNPKFKTAFAACRADLGTMPSANGPSGAPGAGGGAAASG